MIEEYLQVILWYSKGIEGLSYRKDSDIQSYNGCGTIFFFFFFRYSSSSYYYRLLARI